MVTRESICPVAGLAGHMRLKRRYHAWGSLHDHLKDLTPEKVLEVDTSFHRLIRR
jgi:hypothetical protein